MPPPKIANLTPPTATFHFPTVPMTPEKVIALTQSLIDAHITYGLGAKIHPLSLQSFELAGKGQTEVDCSGFVRWCIFHATNGKVVIDDGSVQQHDQIDANGFKHSTVADAHNDDGAIRIGFLSPHDAPGGVGHVCLITGGKTCESHGHHGPDRRVWGSEGWMDKMKIYVLVAP